MGCHTSKLDYVDDSIRLQLKDKHSRHLTKDPKKAAYLEEINAKAKAEELQQLQPALRERAC